MPLKPYLQLVRLPNVFTAAADSLAGWLLVMGTFAAPGRWLPLLGASMAIYAAGIVLNDLFDLDIDREERSSRPLPSGRVSPRFAVVLGFGLLALGLGLAALSGSAASVEIAAILVGCVLAYDVGLKRTWFGPIVMGACRGLNVLLGMSHSADLGGTMGWVVAGSLAVFVVGITWISRSETRSGEFAGPFAGWMLQNVALLGLVRAGTAADRFPALLGETHSPPPAGMLGLLVMLLIAVVVNRASGKAVFDPVPARLQQAVKTGVLSLVWLNVGVVAAVRGPTQALVVAILWVPAFLLSKWLYTT